MMNTNALTVSGLKKKYQEFTLSDISFEVPQGTIVGLIGENGAGKSTIINTVQAVEKCFPFMERRYVFYYIRKNIIANK